MRRLTALSTLMLLAACNFAPKYTQPDGNIPATYRDDRSAVMDPRVASGADLGWKEVFQDARLQALIGASLDANRDLRLAVQRVEEARAQYGITRSDLLPKINGEYQGNSQRTASRVDGASGHEVIHEYSAMVGLTNFEIDFWGRKRNMTEAAFERYLATDEARKAVQLDLIGQVASSYFTMRANQTLLDISQSTVKSYQKTYDLVETRFKAGVASALELSQAKTTLMTAKSRVSSAKRGLEQSKNALNVLTGNSVDWSTLPQGAKFTQEIMFRNIPAGLPSQLLTRRPDIRQAELELRAANADIGAARAAFFPNLSLTAGLGVISPSFGDLFNDSTDAWNFRPTLTLPIFRNGELKNSLDLAKVRSNMAVTQYEKTVQTAFQEVADGLIGETTYKDELAALREKQDAAAKSFELAELRWRSGIDSFLEVQNAQVELFNAQQEYLNASLNSLTNRVEFYKALGGGWSDTTITNPERVESSTPLKTDS